MNATFLAPLQFEIAREICVRFEERAAVDLAVEARGQTLAGLSPGSSGAAIGGPLFEEKQEQLERMVGRYLPYLQIQRETPEEKEAKLLEERQKVMQIMRNNPGMTVGQFLSI